jgi:DDE superfamily endonuclease
VLNAHLENVPEKTPIEVWFQDELPGPRKRRGRRHAKRRHRGDAKHIGEIARRVAPGAHAVLLMDRAGRHRTAKVDMPKNITPIFLPARAPELNPQENIWQYMRGNWLSNTVFETCDAIIDTACEAWNRLTAAPDVINSTGMREWAHVGRCA